MQGMGMGLLCILTSSRLTSLTGAGGVDSRAKVLGWA
jgi:hypothetical protein